jgi:hypothetical protein
MRRYVETFDDGPGGWPAGAGYLRLLFCLQTKG